MNLQKIVKILVLIIGVIAVFFLARIMMIGDEAIESDATNQGIVGSFITLALITLGIAAIITLLFTLKNLLTHPDKLKQALISIGLFAVVVAIAYFTSSGVEKDLGDGKILTAGESQWVEAGIRTFYFLVLAAVGAMAWGGIKKLTNK